MYIRLAPSQHPSRTRYPLLAPFLAYAGATGPLKPLEHSTFVRIAARSNQKLQHPRGSSLMSPFVGTYRPLPLYLGLLNSRARRLKALPHVLLEAEGKIDKAESIYLVHRPISSTLRLLLSPRDICPLAFTTKLLDVKAANPIRPINFATSSTSPLRYSLSQFHLATNQ